MKFQEIRTVRQVEALALLSGSAKSISDVQADYQACIGDVVCDQAFRDAMSSLLRLGMVRYASSGRNEVHPMEMTSNAKMYTLTDDGREALSMFRKLLKE